MVIARVKFLGPDRGGRRTPPRTGYHPQVEVGHQYTSCVIESVEGETTFAFERDHRVALRLLFPEQYPEAFAVGRLACFYEGSHLVGSGVVLDIH